MDVEKITNIIAVGFFRLTIFGYIPVYLCKKKIAFFNKVYLFCFHFFLKNFFLEIFKIDLWHFFKSFQKKKTKYIPKEEKHSRISYKNKKKFFFFQKNLIYPVVKYTDFAGIDWLIKKLQEYFEWPFRFFKMYQKINIYPIKNVLFYGQPGTGKSFLSHVIAGELGIPIFYISPFLISSLDNFGEKNIENLFEFAKTHTPCVVFFDEIDGIVKSRNQFTNETDGKVTGQLVTSIDLMRKKKIFFFIIAATNQIENIDQAFRRTGRFDHEIKLNIPSQRDRMSMLIHFTKKIKLTNQVNLDEISNKTKGFVSGDLFALVQTASVASLFRSCIKIFKGNYRIKTLNTCFGFSIKMIDFKRSFVNTKPILLRYGFSRTDEISWNQVGALNSTRMILSKYIIQPIKTSNTSKKNIGILLYGPPGCGKTLVAKVTAYESEANYISIKGPEIFDKFLGESEKNIRVIFDRARMGAPSILFFDEIDSIVSKRSSAHTSSQNGVSDRIVNQFLIEMDNIEKKEPIYIIGATNRPEMLDKAILRPGRIDKHLLISFPRQKEKIQILITISKKVFVLPYLNFIYLSEIFPYKCSGADLMLLTKEALLNNSEIKLKYILSKNTKKGLFCVLHSFVSVENYLSGFKKKKKRNYQF